MLHKNFDHALERLELFHNGKCYPKDQNISINTRFYSDKTPAQRLRVLRDTGRVPVQDIVNRLGEFTEDITLGHKFGKSWTTHWVLIEIEVPELWLNNEKEVHLNWNASCEGSLFTIDGAKLIQAFTENVRETYIVKRPSVKNDFTDPVVNKTGAPNKISYLIEVACNEMFGNFEAGFCSKVDNNKQYELRKCQLELFNRDAWNLFYDFETLKDGAKEFEKTQSGRAHECLTIANEIMNECHPPFTDVTKIKKAADKTKQYIASKPNAPSQHTVYAVGHCHIDTAWLWPYAETKRKIARSWSSQLELMK